MRRHRLVARKPAILKKKGELAELIKKKLKPIHTIDTHPRGGVYWRGVFEYEGKMLRVFVQNYVRRWGVNYIDMHWMESNQRNMKALTTKEIREMITKLKA